MDMRQERAFRMLAAAVAVLAFLPYVQTAFFDFVMYDDNQYVTSNPMVRQGLSLPMLMRLMGHTWISTTVRYVH